MKHMQENSRYTVGIDIGTSTVRCVVGHLSGESGTPTIVGVGKAPNTGMRKGVVVHLQGPATAIDTALGEAERMSGYQVNAATVSINGSHIFSTKADGMIAVSSTNNEVSTSDLQRLEEVATTGKVPANREILEVVAHAYRLDGQDNIKDPLGMTGTRLEIEANVVSALGPHVHNLQKSADLAKVDAHTIVVSVLASARAVLNEQQIENGVAVIDIGASTTSVAVFEEGDLHYVGIVPFGGNNITNDLAIGLKTDPEIAEKVKIEHGVAVARTGDKDVSVKQGKETIHFSAKDIDEIIEARLEEIFELVAKELKKAGRAGQLPNGVVLTGGGAQMKEMVEFARTQLGLAARMGKPSGFGGVAHEAEQPSYASAIGLMLIDGESAENNRGKIKASNHKIDTKKMHGNMKKASGALKDFLGKFKI